MPAEYHIVARDFHSPLVRNEIWVRFAELWPSLYDLPQPRVGIHAQENRVSYFLDLATWKAAKDILLARIEQDPMVLAEAIAQSEAFGKEMNTVTDRIAQSPLSTWSGEQLWEAYQQFATLQTRQYAVGVLLPLMEIGGESFLEVYLRRYLIERLPEQDVADAFAVLTTPIEYSFAMEQEDALRDLAARMLDDADVADILCQVVPNEIPTQLQKAAPEFATALTEHARRFGWVYYVYQGPAFSEVQFAEFLQDIAKDERGPRARRQMIAQEREDLLAKREALFACLEPTTQERTLLELVATYVWAKPRRKDYQSKSYWHMEHFFREWARRAGVSLRHARAATQAQIREVLLGGICDMAILEEQYKEHCTIFTENSLTVLSGKRSTDFVAQHVAAEETQAAVIDVLRGATAFPGIAKGKVRIVNTPEEMVKIQPGDILVAVATTPSIVPAMKKAAAIVTDEGGLTCHAAIVSRELQIPCVVGLKVATQALHDGDVVEVDAKQGVVTIAERV